MKYEFLGFVFLFYMSIVLFVLLDGAFSFSLDGISMKTVSEMGGLHNVVGLKDHIFFAVPRDSITSLPDYLSANKMGASFETPSGRRLVSKTHRCPFTGFPSLVMHTLLALCICVSLSYVR